MNAYRFLLPLVNNQGISYAGAVDAWRKSALSLAGGYTDNGQVNGAWRDNASVVFDTLASIEVACEPDIAATLAAHALELFADQKSIYVVNVGTATIWIALTFAPEFSAEGSEIFQAPGALAVTDCGNATPGIVLLLINTVTAAVTGTP